MSGVFRVNQRNMAHFASAARDSVQGRNDGRLTLGRPRPSAQAIIDPLRTLGTSRETGYALPTQKREQAMVGTVERANQLAPQCKTMDELRAKLVKDGCTNISKAHFGSSCVSYLSQAVNAHGRCSFTPLPNFRRVRCLLYGRSASYSFSVGSISNAGK